MKMEQKKQTNKLKKEIRSAVINIADYLSEDADAEQDTEKQLLVQGYALVFEQPTTLFTDEFGNEYKEVIDRNALINADMSDVPFKYDHNDNFMILARTRSKTLTLTVDEKGLLVNANLPDTAQGNDLYTLIKRGDIDKMSFVFTVGKDTYDALTHTRRILAIDKLFDVSAVVFPAYEQTSISARDYFTAQIELEEKLKQEEKRKRLILLTF